MSLLKARIACGLVALGLVACSQPASSGAAPPLVLERTIALPGVSGRIDHLALDAQGRRLFVAELGSGAVEAIDLAAGKVDGRIAGLSEPQGLAVTATMLAVASGGDGTVRSYRLPGLQPAGRLDLGADADDVRIDPDNGRLVVGFGAGGLAVIDAVAQRTLATVRLPAHPEGFQVRAGRAWVNLPDAGEIGVVDLARGRLTATWPNRGRRWNFPLAIDPRSGDIAVAYRFPARIVRLDPETGAERQALPGCGDADDLYFDARRPRLYESCGDGHVLVLSDQGGRWVRAALVATRPGARTSLYDTATDRLYVAAPAADGRPAAILVYRPST